MIVRVAVIYSQKSKNFVRAIERAKAELAERMFDLEFYLREGNNKLPDCDVALIDGYCATEHVLNKYKDIPIGILEKADSASVYFRDLCKDPRVDKLFKVSKLHPANENVRNYSFENFILGGQEDSMKKLKVLSGQDLNKVVCGPNFFQYSCLEKWQHLDDDLEKHRNIDVHCVVSTEKYNKNIKAMRKKAVDIVKNMKGIKSITGEGRPYASNVYREQVIDSKIVVAPFGNGYMSYRHAEAMLAGAVVISPDSEFAEAAGHPLVENITYVSCRHDFDDLEDAIWYVLEYWPQFLKLRESAQTMARELWKPESISDIMGRELAMMYVEQPI